MKSARRIITSLVVVAATVCLGLTQDSPQQRWIAEHAIPLATTVAGNGFADMQPLKQIVGNARIVALGEATHGTREFFQLKHRMLEFLVVEMGFSIFSIEANMPEAYRLNDYVLNGNGDPAELIHGMYFWTWDTEEVLSMVQWMREFNKSGKGRVAFTGFDMQTPTVALRIVHDFVAANDGSYLPLLQKAAELASSPQRKLAPGGSANGFFPVEAAAGKKVRFSGWIKSKDVTGYAGFYWRADGEASSKLLKFVNLGSDAPKGTTDWHRYELEMDVPPQTKRILFGAVLSGDGTAWFDDFQVELDGKPYFGSGLDLDFEAPELKGLSASNSLQYPFELTNLDSHSGKQSLRVHHVPERSGGVDPHSSALAWKDVTQHLESGRERFAKTASPKEIEWAIQNARVVLQDMQKLAGEVTRDASMAANVQWILEQSPGAKMVVWAHNGHVSKQVGSMGAELKNLYGEQYKVFGFAFNEGAFQAMGKTMKLTDFTVGPARAGSFDATLAATHLPLFALDFGKLPKEGPVADWFGKAHGSRSIGASYEPENEADFLPDQVTAQMFDAVLFVNKTTAARKLVH